MTAFTKVDMKEAIRLTREGRLAEAMAVLRGAAEPDPLPAGPAAGRDGVARASDASATPILDLFRQAAGSGGVWTMPGSGDGSGTASSDRLPLPKTVRDLRRFAGGLGSAARGDGTPRVLAEGAQFDGHTYSNEAGSRAYKLYVPSGYDGRALPLIVMLHGCTQSPDDFAAGTRMNDLAEEQTFLVAYPAQPHSANPSKCWNWFNAADQRRGCGEPSLIAGITRRIMADFSVDEGRVFIAGLSAGGAAAAIMGSAYPELYSAIGVHSGLACGAARDMPSAFTAMRQGAPAGGTSRRTGTALPTIVFHGDVDTTVNAVNGDQVIAQAKAAVLQITVSHGEAVGGIRFTRTVQTDEGGTPMLEQWLLHGAGHAWSGGSPDGSFTEPRGPDASREMVRFFLQHSAATTLAA